MILKFRMKQLLSKSLGFKQANSKKGNKVTDPAVTKGLSNTYCPSGIFLVEKNICSSTGSRALRPLPMSPLYWAMVRLILQWEKRSSKRPWSGLLKPAHTKQNRWHWFWALKAMQHASWGISKQNNCQQGGPAKHRHKMCHHSMLLEAWVWCGWICTRERDKGPPLLPLSQPPTEAIPCTQCW